MTEEELKKVKFRCVGTMAFEDEHTIAYVSENGRLGICDHTLKKKDGTFGRQYRHWRIDGKVYKSKKKFLDALADYSEKIIPINNL